MDIIFKKNYFKSNLCTDSRSNSENYHQRTYENWSIRHHFKMSAKVNDNYFDARWHRHFRFKN